VGCEENCKKQVNGILKKERNFGPTEGRDGT
jgi:hypothetical protein